MIKTKNGLYDLLELKSKSTLLRSVFIHPWWEDKYANVKIDIEDYDGTLYSMEMKYGLDYIIDAVSKKMSQKRTKKVICNHIDIDEITGSLVTIYSGVSGVFEFYLDKDGVSNL